MSKPNTIESLLPHSGQYSFAQDMRLNGWFMVAVATYLLERFFEVRIGEWSPLARGMCALLPVLPGLLYVRSWWRFIQGMDELQRRIQLEAFLFAALGTVLLGTILNTLAARGVPLGPAAHGLTLGWIYGVMLVLWLGRTLVVLARYK